jgi:quercetin dioxygenase-like cupin family protein
MMILKDIIAQTELSNKPLAQIIKHNNQFKVIAIGLKKGMLWPNHKAMLPTTLLVTKGHVVYKENEREVELAVFDDFEIPVNLVHSLEAKEDSLCILLQG